MRRRWWAATGIILVAGATTYMLHVSEHHPDSSNISAKATPAAPAKPKPVTIVAPTLLASYKAPVLDGLITNEYAHFNPGGLAAARSSDWDVTSGSLFARGGVFWTGNPDICAGGPNAGSTNCTDSDVFRVNTTKSFAGDIKLSLKLKQNTDIHSSTCDPNDTCWYGAHVWLRYQNPFNLYYVSLNRADGQVVIKRKVPCGTSDSGTYFNLSSYAHHDFIPGTWSNYAVTIHTNADQSVTIDLYDTATSTTEPVVSGTDHGGTNPDWSASCTVPGHYSSAAYTPITAAGSVGIRGDYADFDFTDLQVTTLNP